MEFTYVDETKERLDKFLRSQLSHIPRNVIQKSIKQGNITVNNKTTSVHHWLKAGDHIEIQHEMGANAHEADDEAAPEPTVIEKSDDYLVLNKPAGLLMHPTDRNETQTLASWLTKTAPEIQKVGEDLQRPGIVHRLDKDVGGVVVAARNQDTFDYLKKQFQQRSVEKKYYTLVHGRVQNDEGEINTPIVRSKEHGRMVARSDSSTGRIAITEYRVVERFAEATLLDIRILTGRTHQIRTHLYSIGHSVIGDQLYKTRDLKKREKLPLLNRPFLFAYYLSFTDPSGQKKEYSIELSDNLQTILESLRS